MELFGKMKIKILSWLVHHANRAGKNEHFYAIKKRILEKYGRQVGHDLQFIQGKRCHSCGGSGTHWAYYNGGWQSDGCWHCYGGWYKRPTYVWLERYELGRYTFHQPWKSQYTKPKVVPGGKEIIGYIDHDLSEYSDFALNMLFLLYEKGYIKRWWSTKGQYWNSHLWKPRTWTNNIAHLLKHGRQARPFQREKKQYCVGYELKEFKTDDLPF